MIVTNNTKSKYCPICKNYCHEFEEAMGRLNARCPSCGSVERHRLLWLFMEQKTNLFTNEKVKMLHFAPESFMQQNFERYLSIDYLTADISFSRSPMVKVDIQNMVFGDEVFDAIYCSHVLEHVPNDKKAMVEMYRVLKVGGWALIMVPIQLRSPETIEDSKMTPSQRAKHYGAASHLRYYGLDIKNRLNQAGFNVNSYESKALFNLAERQKYGLHPRHRLYFCVKEQLS